MGDGSSEQRKQLFQSPDTQFAIESAHEIVSVPAMSPILGKPSGAKIELLGAQSGKEVAELAQRTAPRASLTFSRKWG